VARKLSIKTLFASWTACRRHSPTLIDLRREIPLILPPSSIERQIRVLVRHELPGDSVSTQQIYRVVLDLHGSVRNHPDCRWTFLQDPVAVEDALGREFPVPSEYDFALLDRILQHKFKTGPGSFEVQGGFYQVLDSRNRSTVLSTESRLRPGSSLIMALMIGLPSSLVFSEQRFPMPECTRTGTRAVQGGGQIW
jgi:hypothetical protein